MGDEAALTVVIPTLNEAAFLPALLEDLAHLRIPHDIVVVDGGSGDGTVELALRAGARVVETTPGRAGQLRAGASAAASPWLFFVHADCRVPEPTLRTLEDFVATDNRGRHGHFAFALEGPGPFWRFLEVGVRLRERLAGLVYGDQGLVVSQAAYAASGGHPEWPIMEDIGVLDRLRPLSEETRLGGELLTSPRRYEREGRLRTWLRHAALVVMFRAGVPPERLASWRERGPRPRIRRLMVFAKAPRPGQVKTRLAADVGDQRAVRIYRVMGRRIVDSVRGGRYGITVHYDPPDALREVVSWLGGDGVSYRAQADGDLGERMAEAFEASFEDADQVCIIGADAPSVTSAVVGKAFDALADHDVVVGPARDGGYYLMALKRPQPDLFAGISWGTATVLDATLERANGMGLSVHRLSPAADVDTLADVPPDLLAV